MGEGEAQKYMYQIFTNQLIEVNVLTSGHVRNSHTQRGMFWIEQPATNLILAHCIPKESCACDNDGPRDIEYPPPS